MDLPVILRKHGDKPTRDAGRDELPTIEVKKSSGWAHLGLGEVWEYRELLVYLVWREIEGAYRQTALGISWLFLRPVLNMLLLSAVFGRLVQVPSDNVPYPLFSLAALLPWGFFSNGVQRAARSLVDNMHMISKVYFPRLVIPAAGAASGLLDLGASFCVLVVAMIVYRTPLRAEILWLPAFMLLALGFSLAVGLWLATLSVRYRDVSFAVAFLLQALMYASPVIYSVSMVPASLRFLYELNPMTEVIIGFRWGLLGVGEISLLPLVLSTVIVVVALLSGAYVFRRTERTVVDML
jgi:lipopolysaccharide transport system permease protein